MARKRTYQEEIISPSLPATQAIILLKQQIGKIDALLKIKYDDPQVDKWDNFTQQVIIKAFGKPHDNLSAYYSVRSGGQIYTNMPDYEIQENFINGYTGLKTLLGGFIEQLEAFGTPLEEKSIETPRRVLSKDIFIVHGHNDQVKNELASIVSKLGFKPIILHEQANQGLTLIEKLEKHSDVGFAFVLLTPDDTGRTNKESKPLSPRARQNVVFEYGLFVGKLTRTRVCCLYTGEVELPSDLHGLVYIPFKSSINEVQLDIIKELKAAGYKIEL